MTEHAAPSAKPGKNAFFFVIIAVILNMLSFGIIMPVMPALLEDITGLGAAQSVVYGGWLSMTFAIANFFAMPILGGLSDRYGRRPVLLASIGMLGVDLLIMGLAPTLSVLFIGRFLGGLFSGTYSVANAYIADVTEPEERGRAFGMRPIAYDLYWDEAFATQHDVERCDSPEDVLRQADYISLHMPSTDETRGFVNRQRIGLMKDTAILVNTARGTLVVEQDIADACRNGQLGAYATDVLAEEPIKTPHVFTDVDNIIVTPHVGSRTYESVERQAVRATKNIVNYLTGDQDFIQANPF